MELCDDAFRPRKLQNLPIIKHLEFVENKNSTYKSKPLEAALRSSFRVADEPIFGGQHSLSSVKVAVTSALSTGNPAVLFTNYNRPSGGSRERKTMLTMMLFHTENILQLSTYLSGPRTLNLNSKCGRRKCTIEITNNIMWLTTYLGHELRLLHLCILNHS